MINNIPTINNTFLAAVNANAAIQSSRRRRRRKNKGNGGPPWILWAVVVCAVLISLALIYFLAP